MLVKTNSACNTLDGKMFNFMKGVTVDFSWVNEALDKINDEIAKINDKIESMFPSGAILNIKMNLQMGQKGFHLIHKNWYVDG